MAAFGFRHRGLPGAATAVIGLLATPVTIIIALGLLYERYGSLPISTHALGGLAAAAAGLILGTTDRAAAVAGYAGAVLGFKVAIATGDSHDAAHLAHFSSWRMR